MRQIWKEQRVCVENTYTVIFEPQKSSVTPVTVPAEFVSVRVNTDMLPLVENSVFNFVFVDVRLVSVLMTTCTIPTVVGVIH